MLSEWLQLQWVILPILAIPLATLIGMRWANGAILVCGVGAVLAVAYVWYRRVTDASGYYSSAGGLATTDGIVAQVGAILLLAAWILALAHAVQSRRWVWFALIVLAGYLSYSTNILAEIVLNPCGFIHDPSGDASFPICQSPSQVRFSLVALGQALGPAACMLYVFLGARGQRRPRQLPEGLIVSSLRSRHDGLAADEGAIRAD